MIMLLENVIRLQEVLMFNLHACDKYCKLDLIDKS